jgi:hypothetical protein
VKFKEEYERRLRLLMNAKPGEVVTAQVAADFGYDTHIDIGADPRVDKLKRDVRWYAEEPEQIVDLIDLLDSVEEK